MSASVELAAVRPEIAGIFAEAFQYEGPITPATGVAEVQRWDSLQHIALVRLIEETFGISLTMDEMMEMRSAGDIDAVLARHGV